MGKQYSYSAMTRQTIGLPFYLALCGTLCAGLAVLAGQSTIAPKQTKPGKKSPTSGGKSPAVDPAQLKAGKTVFGTYCGICHLSDSAEKKIGPGLKGLGKRGKFADGNKIDDASLRAWIEKGGKTMPPFKDTLSAEQMRDVLVYLKTL
jgi:cytochrome c